MGRSRVRFVPAVILLTLAPLPLQAQGSVAQPLRISVPSPTFQLAPSSPRPAAMVRSTSYWAEGGAAGAGVLGLLGIVMAGSLCSTSDNTNDSCVGPIVSFALLGAGVGFTIGALVGARFPKQ